MCMDFDDDDNSDDEDDVAMNSSTNKDQNSVVRYLHIAEVPDQYTIGIFVFGPNQRIPLHDHPEMCVLSRVLYGDLHRLSLDLDRCGDSKSGRERETTATTTTTASEKMGNNNTNDDSDDDDDNDNDDDMEGIRNDEDPRIRETLRNFLERQIARPDGPTDVELQWQQHQQQMDPHRQQMDSSSWLSRSAKWLRSSLNGSSDSIHATISDNKEIFPEGTKIAFKNGIDVLQAPDVASLYPYEGNLHEFVAGPHGAAVLDVLLPPYDDEHPRDCTFYHIREVNSIMDCDNINKNVNVQQTRLSTASSSTSISNSTSSSKNNNNNDDSHNSNTNMPFDSDECDTSTTREPCLIVPTGQPENFHCISGRYRDLGSSDDIEEESQDDDDCDGPKDFNNEDVNINMNGNGNVYGDNHNIVCNDIER